MPNLLAATAAFASVVRSRAFCAVSVTPSEPLTSEAMKVAVMSRSAVLTAEPRVMPISSRFAVSASLSDSSESVWIGSAMALAAVASIATTETEPPVAPRRAFSTRAVVEPVSRLRAWMARASMTESLVAATASDAAVTETPRTATRTVSSTLIWAAPALIGAGSEPSFSPSPATVFFSGSAGSGASVAARMRTAIVPELAARIAALPAAESRAGSPAAGAAAGSVPRAGTPRSTLVRRVTFCVPVSPNILRMSMAADAFAAALAALSRAGSSRCRLGTAAASIATRVVVTSVLSSAEICTATAGSLSAIVPLPLWTICAPLATVTCVVFRTVDSADLISPFAANSMGVNTSAKLPSPVTALFSFSKVPVAASVTVAAPGSTRPSTFTSTLAAVLAAIFTVPPLTAPLAPTAMVALLVWLGVMLLSCEDSVETRVIRLPTSAVSAASPVPASTVPSRVIPARPLAVTLMVEVSAGTVSETVMSLETLILTPAPRITAFSFTVTLI